LRLVPIDTPGPMPIDEKLLMDLCERAAREKDRKKLLALTKQIDALLAELLDDRERDKLS
jgi:hypothetical protein